MSSFYFKKIRNDIDSLERGSGVLTFLSVQQENLIVALIVACFPRFLFPFLVCLYGLDGDYVRCVVSALPPKRSSEGVSLIANPS